MNTGELALVVMAGAFVSSIITACAWLAGNPFFEFIWPLAVALWVASALFLWGFWIGSDLNKKAGYSFWHELKSMLFDK